MTVLPFSRRLARLVLLPVSLVLTAAAVSGQAASSTPQAQVPVTPGSLVLMRDAGDPRAIPAVREALSAPDPALRAVAARIVAVGRLMALRSNLLTAFTAELDSHVAAEQIRAILVLGAQDMLDAAAAHMQRAESPARVAYALGLARTNPAALVAQLPVMTGRAGELSGQLAPTIRLATQRFPEHRLALHRAWLEHAPPKDWGALVGLLAFPPVADAAEVPVYVAALRSEHEPIREATVWAVVEWMGTGRPVPEALLNAAATPAPAVGEGATWEAFGRELVARAQGRGTVTDRAPLIASVGKDHQFDARDISGLSVLTRSEQSAINALLGGPAPRRQPPPATATNDKSITTARTLENIWPGFVDSLFEASGCKPPNEWRFGGIRLTYGADGRPVEAAIDSSQLSKECAVALSGLVQVTLAEDEVPVAEGDRQWVLLPVAREFAACLAQPWAALRTATLRQERNAGADIREPRKTRDRKPTYPPAALKAGISGVVILEATIAADGCVKDLSVLRSVDTVLDIEALRTVAQWRYTPGTLGGKPVDVIMTVTVNFTLR